MRIYPTGKRLLVRPHEAPETTKGGIVLPDQAKEKPRRGTVLEVGPGLSVKFGDPRPNIDVSMYQEARRGSSVLYAAYAGTEVKGPEGETLLLLHQRDVIAVVEE